MKSRKLMCFSAAVLFASMAVPAQLSAQHHHYKLIDMRTFGGPLSGINEALNYVPAVNARGQTVGFSANSVAQSTMNNPAACFGTTISHGFEFQNE